MGITEGSASAEWTTEGSAEALAEGTFGRSLPSMNNFSRLLAFLCQCGMSERMHFVENEVLTGRK